MPQGSAWFITGKKAKTKKKQSQIPGNSLTREHSEHGNAWVPSQGGKE